MVSPLTIVERPGLSFATIMARRGVDSAMLEATLGFTPPEGPMRAEQDGLALVGTGPNVWLAMNEAQSIDWPAALAQKLQGLASISDQSGGYTIFRISGDYARSLLQRGASIDLHADLFCRDSAATTVIAHISVILWQIDDRTFDIATFRSYAPSLRRWLTATAATF